MILSTLTCWVGYRSSRRLVQFRYFGFLPFLIASCALFSNSLYAQDHIVIESVDKSQWPLVSARFYMLSPEGKSYRTIEPSDYQIYENGTERKVVNLSCPEEKPPSAISAVLTIDISGSMRRGKKAPNIELAREAAQAWIDALPVESSECAITSFNSKAYVLTDMVNNRTLLRSALEKLDPDGGTSYIAAFLSSPTGALSVVEKGENRRVIIFLTDGLNEIDPETVVKEAKSLDASIYCITLGMRAPDVLRTIAEQTGGAWFENVTTIDQARAIYQALLYRALGNEPCEVTWRSAPDCNPERSIELSCSSPSVTSGFSYIAPEHSISRLSLRPSTIFFDSTTREVDVTLSAPGSSVSIESIKKLSGSNTFKLDIPSLPINLESGQSRTLTIRSNTSSSESKVEQWQIQSTCYPVTLTARRSNRRHETIPVQLVTPNGGEVFRAGETALITWDGVSEHIPVKLEYSINDGTSWTQIAEGITGGIYRWRVPGTPSDQCLARVSVFSGEHEARQIATLPVEDHHWALDPKGAFVTGYLGDTTIITTSNQQLPAGKFGRWDTEMGELVKTWTVIGNPHISYKDPTPETVEYDPTGRYLLCGNYMLSASSGKVLWWNSGTQANVHGYMADDMITPSFSHDGSRLLRKTSNDGGEVLGIFDSKTGEILATVGDPRLGVFTGVFSPDGTTVLTAARDGVTLWDAETGKILDRLTEHPSYSAVYSPSGKYVAAIPEDADTVLIWDRETEDQPARRLYLGKRAKGYRAARIAPDESGAVVWRDGKPGIADVLSGNLINEYGNPHLEGKSVRSPLRLIYSPDGTMVATVEPYGSGIKQIAVYDATSGDVLSVSRDTGSMVGVSTSISQDGSRLLWSYGDDLVIAELNGNYGSDKSDNLWSIVGKADPEFVDVDFGIKKVGTVQDSVVSRFLENRGDAPLYVNDIKIIKGDHTEFALVSPLPPFTVEPGEASEVEFRFAPASEGNKLAFAVMETDVGQLSSKLIGNASTTVDVLDDRYPDPTTFRTIAVPNAVIPPKGTLVLGSYDLLGLMAGYAFTDNLMVLAGGAPPLPDDWGGTQGDASAAYSIGLKGNLHLDNQWQVAAGFQWAASFFEDEKTVGNDSRITAPTLYGAISYGNDDRRLSFTGGYAFKHHTTLVDPERGLFDEFPRQAPIVVLGGDWRIGDRWKLAAEGIYMRTLGTAPIITTARWFGKDWGLDFGAAWLLIETGEDDPPSFPVLPIISFIWTGKL